MRILCQREVGEPFSSLLIKRVFKKKPKVNKVKVWVTGEKGQAIK